MAPGINRITTGSQTGAKVIAQKETTEYSLLVEVNTDETECFVSCLQNNPSATIKAEELFNIIHQAGIKKKFIDIDAVNKFCNVLKNGNDPGKRLLQKGTRQPLVQTAALRYISAPLPMRHITSLMNRAG